MVWGGKILFLNNFLTCFLRCPSITIKLLVPDVKNMQAWFPPIMITHLNFFSRLPFWYNSDFGDIAQKVQFPKEMRKLFETEVNGGRYAAHFK